MSEPLTADEVDNMPVAERVERLASFCDGLMAEEFQDEYRTTGTYFSDVLAVVKDWHQLRDAIAARDATITKFSALADERHDMLFAERRTNDQLRADLTTAKEERDKLKAKVAT